MDSYEKDINHYVDSLKEALVSQQLNIDSLNSEINFRTKQVALALDQYNRTITQLNIAQERLAEEVENKS